MAGNATKRIVVSRNTANTARLVDVSTIQGLRAGGDELTAVGVCNMHEDYYKQTSYY